MNRRRLVVIVIGVLCASGVLIFWVMQPNELRNCLARGLNHSLYEWIDDVGDRQDMKKLTIDFAITARENKDSPKSRPMLNIMKRIMMKIEDINSKQKENKTVNYFFEEWERLERYNCQY